MKTPFLFFICLAVALVGGPWVLAEQALEQKSLTEEAYLSFLNEEGSADPYHLFEPEGRGGVQFLRLGEPGFYCYEVASGEEGPGNQVPEQGTALLLSTLDVARYCNSQENRELGNVEEPTEQGAYAIEGEGGDQIFALTPGAHFLFHPSVPGSIDLLLKSNRITFYLNEDGATTHQALGEVAVVGGSVALTRLIQAFGFLALGGGGAVAHDAMRNPATLHDHRGLENRDLEQERLSLHAHDVHDAGAQDVLSHVRAQELGFATSEETRPDIERTSLAERLLESHRTGDDLVHSPLASQSSHASPSHSLHDSPLALLEAARHDSHESETTAKTDQTSTSGKRSSPHSPESPSSLLFPTTPEKLSKTSSEDSEDHSKISESLRKIGTSSETALSTSSEGLSTTPPRTPSQESATSATSPHSPGSDLAGLVEKIGSTDSEESGGKIANEEGTSAETKKLTWEEMQEKICQEEDGMSYAEWRKQLNKRLFEKEERLGYAGFRAVTDDPEVAKEFPDVYMTEEQLVEERNLYLEGVLRGRTHLTDRYTLSPYDAPTREELMGIYDPEQTMCNKRALNAPKPKNSSWWWSWRKR